MSDPNPNAICKVVLDHSTEAAFSSRDGVIDWIAEGVKDILGWAPGDLIGRTSTLLWHPDDHDEAARIREATRRGQWVDGCLRLRHRDGHFVRVDLRAGPMDDDASGSTVVGSLRATNADRPASRQLADAEPAYKVIADCAKDVVATVDSTGVVLTMTPSVESWLGWRPEELIGTFLPSLTHPDDRGRLAAYRHEVRQGVMPGRMEMRVQARGGTWKWASASGALASGPNGEPVIAVGWRDIDDLMHAREAAEEEAERLRATLDSSLDPRVMLTAVRNRAGDVVDFRFDDANARACAALGLVRDRVIGMRLLDVSPVVADNGLLDAYIRAVEYGEPCEIDDVPIADAVAGTSRRYDIRAQAVGDSLMYTWRDVTERSRAAEESAQAAVHFGTIARHAGDVVAHIVDGIVVWCAESGHALLQCRVGERFDEHVKRLLDPGDRQRLTDLQSAVAVGMPYVGVWHAMDDAGQMFDLLVRAEGRGQDGGIVMEIVIVVTDVTGVAWDSEPEGELEGVVAPDNGA